MSEVLFINSCPRSRIESRTIRLCDEFIRKIKEMNPEYNLTELDLFKTEFHLYGLKEIQQRDQLIMQKNFSHEMFQYANQFAKADKIIIGAPYWDLSFPAVIKVYIEAICVNGITFCYTDHGPKGLSAFDKMIYITTSGGYVGSMDLGVQYIKAMSEFLGTGCFEKFSVEGLDIVNNDENSIMNDALMKIRNLAIVF